MLREETRNHRWRSTKSGTTICELYRRNFSEAFFWMRSSASLLCMSSLSKARTILPSSSANSLHTFCKPAKIFITKAHNEDLSKSRPFYWRLLSALRDGFPSGSFDCLNWQNHSIKWTSIYRALFCWSSFWFVCAPVGCFFFRLSSETRRSTYMSYQRVAWKADLQNLRRSNWLTVQNCYPDRLSRPTIQKQPLSALSRPYLFWRIINSDTRSNRFRPFSNLFTNTLSSR